MYIKKFNESSEFDIFENVEYLEDILVEIQDFTKFISIEYCLQKEYEGDLMKVGVTSIRSFKDIKLEFIGGPFSYDIYKAYVINFYYESNVVASDEQRTGRKYCNSDNLSNILKAFNSIKYRLKEHTVLYTFDKKSNSNFSIMIIEGKHE